MRIQDAVQDFLQHLRACGRSEHAVAQYGRHLGLLARWAAQDGRGEDLAACTKQKNGFLLSPQAILGASGAMRSPTTLNAFRGSVRGFFAWAEAAGLVASSPASLLRRAMTAPPPPRALSPAERERLVAALECAQGWVERRDRALFLAMLGTGIRLGAALALRIEDVDLEDASIAIRTKGGVRVRLPLAPSVAALLAVWLPEAGPVFPARSGAPLGPRQAQARFRAWCRRAGIRRASPHALRHYPACLVIPRRRRGLRLAFRTSSDTWVEWISRGCSGRG